jgi:ubiquinone/menaquinone biosynthesis C-methylase UbiE
MAGRESRGLWGADRRFDAERIRRHPSVRRHFESVVAAFIRPDDVVLDLGCGPGGFLAAAASHCRSITGVDVVPAFVTECQATIDRLGLTNASTLLSDGNRVPADDGTFDAAILVDVIHHCEDPVAVLADVRRVLRPGGRLLVFEPNKGNPLLALMCALDRNEWGLLRLGSRRAYRKLLHGLFDIDRMQWSGLLVGPEGRLAMAVADAVSGGPLSGVAGWLSPKHVIAARRA